MDRNTKDQGARYNCRRLGRIFRRLAPIVNRDFIYCSYYIQNSCSQSVHVWNWFYYYYTAVFKIRLYVRNYCLFIEKKNEFISKMINGNLADWKLFRNNPEILRDYTEVHVFNWGDSAILVKNDELYAFGIDNPCFRGLGPTNTPKEIRFLDHCGVQAIATGLEHAVLLDYNHIVYCWGNNDHGQLGTGNNLSNFIYKEHSLPPIRQISCGQFCTLALSYDNEVWFWGRQFNVSVRGKIRAVPIQITLPDYINVESIIAGCGDAAIIDTEGTVYVWGFNGCGQLGLGHRNIVSDPKPVHLFSGCQFVIIARNRTAFVTQSGEFYISGSDRSLEDFELQTISFPGKITSIAASWGKDIFAITNDLGEVLRWGHDAPSTETTKTNCTNIVEVFKDFWTPTVLPINVEIRQGIIKHVASRRRNPTRVTGTSRASQFPTPDTTSTIKLTSSIPKSDTASAKVGGCIDVSGQFNEQICSDLTIKLSDDNIHAHKLVLYMKSKYFKSLLEKSSKDIKTLDMSNWSSRAYKAYIKYLYTGELMIEAAEDIPEIYSLAEQDNDKNLQQDCMTLWRKNLKSHNVINLFHSAYNCQQQIFLQECATLLQEHLPRLILTEEYLKLPESEKLSLALTVALLKTF